MAARWDLAEPVPYPDDAGVKARQLDGPVGRPVRAAEPMTATRRDGTECDIRGTLPGLRDPADVPDEDRVRWRPWP